MLIIERIRKYIDYKGISRYKFYKLTGLSNGFLDKNSNIGSDKCELILTIFPDLNSDWLMLEKGEMLRSISNSITNQHTNEIDLLPKSDDARTILLKELLKEKEIEIKDLNREIGRLQQELKYTQSKTNNS